MKEWPGQVNLGGWLHTKIVFLSECPQTVIYSHTYWAPCRTIQ